MFMKPSIRHCILAAWIPVAGLASIAFAHADEPPPEPAVEDDEQKAVELVPMEIQGEIIRPNMIGVLPEQGGMNDAALLLQRVPGGNVNGLGPLSGIAQYRGMYGDRVNVDFKGMNYKPACANSMDAPLSHIPAAMTSLLKVYRGIAPVSSGIETIGGAIVQETRRPEFTTPGESARVSGKISAGINEVNSGRYAAAYLGVAGSRHRLHFYGSREKGDDFDFPGGKNVPTRHDRTAIEAGYGFRRNAHGFDIDLNYNDTGPTGTPALPMDITSSEGEIVTASYSGGLAEDVRLSVDFNWQDIDHAMDNFTLRTTPATGRRLSDNTSEGFGYRLKLEFPLFSGVALLGADGDNANHDAVITNPDQAIFRIDNFNNAERDRYGWFAEWKGSPWNHWELDLGGRLNYIVMDAGEVSAHFQAPPWRTLVEMFNARERAREDVNVDASVVLRRSFEDDLELELGVARKTRSPSYQERFLWAPLEATGGLSDGFLYIGDPDLDPEVSHQAELGLTWRAGSFFIEPRLFYRDINDYIQGVPATNPAALAIAGVQRRPLLRFANIDARLYGADVEFGFRYRTRWRIDGTLSYVRGERADANDNLFKIAPLNGLLSVFYEAPRWTLGAEFVAYASQNKVSDFNNEPATSGYALFNLRAQVDLARGFQLGAGIENLLDRDYRVHLNGLNRALNNVESGIGLGERLPGAGRNLYATVSYEW